MKCTVQVVLAILVVVCSSPTRTAQTQTSPKKAEWQSDWTKFIEAYEKYLAACPGEKMSFTAFSDCVDKRDAAFCKKPVSWSGIFTKIDDASKMAILKMTPTDPTVTLRYDTGATVSYNLSCCNLDISDKESDAWKALRPGTWISFAAVLPDGAPAVKVGSTQVVGRLMEVKILATKNP